MKFTIFEIRSVQPFKWMTCPLVTPIFGRYIHGYLQGSKKIFIHGNILEIMPIFEFQYKVSEVCHVIFQAPVKSGLRAIEGPCPEKAGDTLEPPSS